jgi:hypothetical protein
MSTRINVTVGDGGLLDRNAQQTAANRQARVLADQRATAEAEGVERRAADRTAAGLDPLTGLPAFTPTSASTINRLDQEPAANRRLSGVLVTLTPTAAAGPVTEFDGPVSTKWFNDFGIISPSLVPRRWWLPTRQQGFSPKIAFAEPPVGFNYAQNYLRRVDNELRGDNAQLAGILDSQSGSIRIATLNGFISAGPIEPKLRKIKKIEFGARLFYPEIPDPAGWSVVSRNRVGFVVTGSSPDPDSSEPIINANLGLATDCVTQRNSPNFIDLPTFQRSTRSWFTYIGSVFGSPTFEQAQFNDIPRDEWLAVKVVLTKTNDDPFAGNIQVTVGEQTTEFPFQGEGGSTLDQAVNLGRIRDFFESTLFDFTIETQSRLEYTAIVTDPLTGQVVATFDRPDVPPDWRLQNMYYKMT